MIDSGTIRFLKQLSKNNNKPWFDEHRADYEGARADFAAFIQKVIDQHGKKDPGIRNLVAKDCMFRINRDVRFSKNKAPYKTNMGASINKSGKKAEHSAGYYFHLEPGASFVGGGIWMPPADTLKKIRQEIDYNLKEFTGIIKARAFKSVYGELDSSPEFKLSRVPRGYDPENPAAEFLKYKSYLATMPLSDADLGSKTLLAKVGKAFEALQPLIEFLNREE
jgi:uncharacterized protein (TIGR02453 family)